MKPDDSKEPMSLRQLEMHVRALHEWTVGSPPHYSEGFAAQLRKASERLDKVDEKLAKELSAITQKMATVLETQNERIEALEKLKDKLEWTAGLFKWLGLGSFGGVLIFIAYLLDILGLRK